MSSEFYSRLKFHKRLGIFMLAVMQAFFSCLFLRLDIFSTKGAALAIGMAVYMVLIVVLKLYDLYGRPIQDMIKTESLLAGGIGLVAVIILCILEDAGVILPVIAECLLTIAIYVLWIRLMKLWFKREFGPHQYVCIADNEESTGELMELDRLDGSIFSSGKYFGPEDDQAITDYMELFKVGIMVISKASKDTYGRMLSICSRFNAMAFLTEMPQLQEYEGNIREVYIGGRKLWLYLPQN